MSKKEEEKEEKYIKIKTRIANCSHTHTDKIY